MASAEAWTGVWTWCARLSCVPWIAGAVVLVATRDTTSWIPSASVVVGCWIGLALVLCGLFGLIALRRRRAEERLPWTRSTFAFGLAGMVGSLLVGSAAVLVLSTIDVLR